MKSTALFATIAAIFVCLCDSANIRVQRSDNEPSLDLDSNGFCKTARSWTRDCNQCWCPEGGAPACTLMGCSIRIPDLVAKVDIQPVIPIPIVRDTNLDAKCVPGTKWMKDCNECSCSDNGLSLCTKMECAQVGGR